MEMNHVAYLGSFYVGGVLILGHLYKANDVYSALHLTLNGNGTFGEQWHDVSATDLPGAVGEAQYSIRAFLQRQGFDVRQILMLHFSPVAATIPPEWLEARPTHEAPAGLM